MSAGDARQLGQLVRLQRVALGLSVRAISRRAGVDRDTWSAVEDGARSTQDSKYRAIERVLGWLPGSIDQILSGGGPILPGSERPELRGGVDRQGDINEAMLANLHKQRSVLAEVDAPDDEIDDFIQKLLRLWDVREPDAKRFARTIRQFVAEADAADAIAERDRPYRPRRTIRPSG